MVVYISASRYFTREWFKSLRCLILGALLVISAVVGEQTLSSTDVYAQSPTTVKQSAPVVSGITVPFIPMAGHGGPVVVCRVNDKLDVRFLIDTGSDTSVIHPEIAKRLALPLKSRAAGQGSTTAQAPKSTINYVTIDKLKIGELTFEGDFDVLDTAPDLPNKSYDGILSANALRSLAVLLDFSENKMVLIPNGGLNNEQLQFLGMSGGTSAGVAMSLIVSSEYIVSVPVLLEGVTGSNMVIDTGSSRTMILDPDKKIKLPSGVQGIASDFQTVGRSWNYTVYPFETFGVGNTLASAKPNTLTNFECGVIAPDAKQADSILGLNYLSRFRILLDYPAKRFYLKPVHNPRNYRYPTEASRQSAEASLADMALIPTKGDEWKVTGTEKGGVFGKYGITEGDVIKKINGQSVDGIGICEVYTLLLKNGNRAEIELRRDGKTIKLTLEKKSTEK